MAVENVACDTTNWFAITLQFFLPLAAAFVGSYCAYLLSIRKEKDKQRQERILSGQEVLFTMIRQLNTIAVINKQRYSIFKKDKLRHFIIPPDIIGSIENISINLNYISYLLPTEFRNTLHEIFILDELYHTTINAIKYRSTTHIEFQDNVEKHTNGRLDSLSEAELTQAAGLKICITLQKITEEIYLLIEECLEKYPKAINKLADELEILFPGNKFIRADLGKKT